MLDLWYWLIVGLCYSYYFATLINKPCSVPVNSYFKGSWAEAFESAFHWANHRNSIHEHTITMHPGVYELDRTIYMEGSNLTLEGQPDHSAILDCSNLDGSALNIKGNYNTIKNLSITNFKTGIEI